MKDGGVRPCVRARFVFVRFARYESHTKELLKLAYVPAPLGSKLATSYVMCLVSS